MWEPGESPSPRSPRRWQSRGSPGTACPLVARAEPRTSWDALVEGGDTPRGAPAAQGHERMALWGTKQN